MSRLTPVLEYFIGSLVFCQRDVVLPPMFKVAYSTGNHRWGVWTFKLRAIIPTCVLVIVSFI